MPARPFETIVLDYADALEAPKLRDRDHPTLRTAKGFPGSAPPLGVERTFGWMMRWRRLVRDYEKRIDVSHAMIHVAMGSLLVRRS